MTTDAIYEECGSDWSHQVSAVGTTRWLQRDQTLPLSAKGVACETNAHTCGSNSTDSQLSNVDILHSRWYRESDKLEIVLEKKNNTFCNTHIRDG